MTAPEANQQYDLWVDRCRQQLERGAAGNALAAWMQSEGVSADLAATILEAARGQPAAASGQPAQGDPAAAAPPETAVQETPVQETTVPESTVPESTVPNTPVLQAEAAASLGADSAVPNRDGAAPDHTTVTTPAQPAPMPGNAAEVFAKAFGKPDKTAHGGTMATPPVPGQPDATPTMEPAPATGVQPVSPPQPPAQTASPQEPPTATGTPDAHGDPAAATAAPVTPPLPQTAVPQEHALDPPSPPSAEAPNPFGTPRPPIVFSPAPAPTEDTPHEDESPADPTLQEAPATMEAGDDARQDVEAPPDDAADEVPLNPPDSPDEVLCDEPAPAEADLLNESDSPVAEPDPDSGVDAADRSDDGAPPDAAHEVYEDPEIPAPDESDAAEDGHELQSGHDDGECLEEEPADTIVAAFDAADHPEPTEAPAEAPAADSVPDEPQQDDRPQVTDAPDEPYRFEDSLEDAASRMGMDLREGPRSTPAKPYDDFIVEEPQRGPEPSDGSNDISGMESDNEPARSTRKTVETRSFGQRDGGGPTPVDTADGGDDGSDPAAALRDADGNEPSPRSSDPADGAEGELARAIREAERRTGRESDPPPRRPEPKTEEEELAAAAKELGISFRDDSETGRSDAADEPDDEMKRTARELGISFRDEPAGADATDPDDPIAKAAQELGISFRDSDQPKAERKSLLVRYWPVILLMVLAAIAMPIVGTYLMFAGD